MEIYEIVEFDDVGGGLIASNGILTGFEIAGSDGNYQGANAVIVNGRVEVFNRSIQQPVSVRYAWRDDSTASLFNVEGLPASSFTSED